MQRRDRLDAAAVALMLLLCALWGAQQAVVKIGVQQGLPPVLQALLRSVIATVLICLWVGVRQGGAALRGVLRHDARTVPGLVLAAVFAVEFMLIYTGLRLTSASRAVLFLYTAPFFTALGAHWFLPAERLRPVQVAGLLIAFAGVAAAFAEGWLHGGGSLLGDAMCAIAGAMWGGSTVMVKGSPGLRGTEASLLLLYQIGGSVPFLLLGAIAMGEMHHWPDATAVAWLGLAYQGVIVAFASYLAWFWLLLIYPAAKVAGFTFLTPVFGIIGGALLLGETLSAALLIGLAAIAIGLRLLNSAAPAAARA